LKLHIVIFLLVFSIGFNTKGTFAQGNISKIQFDFYGDNIVLEFDTAMFIRLNGPLSEENILAFNTKISKTNYRQVISSLLGFKDQYKLDDWLFYQLVRKTAQQVSPKAENYHRYTLYKWFLLSRSGYDAILSIHNDRILFYVQSDENIYNIPNRIKNGKQYVCLNYHDYGIIDFDKDYFSEVVIPLPEATKGFSYKVTHLPNFRPGDYLEKDIRFNYNEHDYYFKVKLNPEIKTIFINYPVVDFESYFNIPLSAVTYQSLIPLLKKNVKGKSIRNGVDFLMRFTRYAFLFEPDSTTFGKEKRLSPEQTLIYEQSDCEDRAALFFYLVKEIYNLPMIVLSFPRHVTVAVKFKKPVGKPIVYNGSIYSVCEPTPQQSDIPMGRLIPELENIPYEIVYAYSPENK
jgi:hypothetical protein